MKDKKRFLGVLLISLLLLFIGCSAKEDQADSQGQTEAQDQADSQSQAESQDPTQPAENNEIIPAPNITVFNKDGEEVHLLDYVGQPLVLNFWASWCPPCQNEMPAFQAAYDQFGDDVQFFMINMTEGQEETQSSAEAFLEENDYDFPVYYDLYQEDNFSESAANRYQVENIPTSFFIDREGNIQSAFVGEIEEYELFTRLEELIEK